MSLLFSDNFGASWSEKPVTPNKVVLKKQVFTLINIVLRDGGIYACRATDQSGKTIQWPSNHGLFFVQSGALICWELDHLHDTRNILCKRLNYVSRGFSGGKHTIESSQVIQVNMGLFIPSITRHFWGLEWTTWNTISCFGTCRRR